MATDSTVGAETRQRLIEAAGEVFAEHGFRVATVREISKRAGTNVAAVNYHFRDKEGLYAAVLQYAHRYAMEKNPPPLDPSAYPSLQDRLRAFIRSLLARVFDPGRPSWHGKLMAWEMFEPTSALDALVENSIRPLFELLSSIVRELLGPKAPVEMVRLCAMSIVGQCLHYHHCRAVMARLMPEQSFGEADVPRLAEHITLFSTLAMQSLRRTLEGAG